MPDRGVQTDLSCLREVPAADFDQLQAANKDNPAAQAFWHSGAQPDEDECGRRAIMLGTDGNTP